MEDVKKNTQETPKKVNDTKHKEFIEGVIPKHMIRSMRDLIIVMANKLQEKNPQLNVNEIINRCLMTQGD